ncbi:MAG: hypothetical protein ACP5XB_10920 [Isosphaeraceae bacterium]
METSLHRALKVHYGTGSGGQSEVVLKGFRVDAVGETGLLVEIQSGALGPLRTKLRKLLPDHQVQVVKPVPIQRRVIRRARPDGPNLSARRSPRRGAILDIFEDLVGLAQILADPNLVIEILGVAIDEVRVPRRRRPGYRIADRSLIEVLDRRKIERPADLWTLLPGGYDWTEPFTTADIARRIDRPLWFAQRVAYCLRLSGAALIVGKRGNQRVYANNELVDCRRGS